ncbi:MAG: choice-of-anchor I family protein [Eubacteriales bacterium]|nr:choice-of-anchor I family protein [Eubacteriales bacterium]
MKKQMNKLKRVLTAVIAVVMVITLIPAEYVLADEPGTGVDHVIVNQVYGGSTDGYASHSFIELYNPTDNPINLTGWSVQYKPSESGVIAGQPNTWQKLELTGWIGAEDYYLIRCGAVADTTNVKHIVPEGNQEWNLSIHNKGFSVVLVNNNTLLDEDFSGNVLERTDHVNNADYVDCLAAQGNDGTDVQAPIAYEGAYEDIQSKKKSIRRTAFADTNDNAADSAPVDYSKTVSADEGPHKGTYGGKLSQTITLGIGITSPVEMNPEDTINLGASAQTALTYESSNEAVASVSSDGTVTAKKGGKAVITITAAEDTTYDSATLTVEICVGQGFTLKMDGFENGNALPLKKLGSYVTGVSNPDGGVAEIVSYDKKNNHAWVVNGATGKLDIISLDPVTGKTGTDLTATSLDVKALVEAKDSTFAYGDMTSVSVNSDLGIVAVALQEADYMKDGKVAILDLDGNLLALLPAGCQPDMVTFTFTPDGTKILTANEGEPRYGGLGSTDTDPKGSVTIITLNENDFSTSVSENIYFDEFDSQRGKLVEQGIILAKDVAPSFDLEPEYIAADNTKAYIALQEANAIAVLNLRTKTYEGIYSLGYKDLSDPKNAADVEDDGEYKPDTYVDTVAAYMPDGIALYQAGGTTYLLTANEGDAREWGDYANEAKQKLIKFSDDQETNKVRVIDPAVTDGLPSGKNVMFGGRSFSIYQMTDGGMTQVYDSANDFEKKTADYLPSYFNASNDDNDFDSRSQKKGPEPESVVVGTVDGTIYAFIALERIGGIMVYNISDPMNPQYVNYINSRDFAEDPSEAAANSLKSDIAPEGLYFINSASSPSGTPILLTAFEVSGTMAAYSVGTEPTGNTGTGETPQDPNPGTGGGSAGTAKPGQEGQNGGAVTAASPEKTNSTPRTGDQSLLMIMMALLALSGAAIIILVRKKSK